MTEFSTIMCINCGQSTDNVVRAGGRIRSAQEWCEGCRIARDNPDTRQFRTAVAAQMQPEPIPIPAQPTMVTEAERPPTTCTCGSTNWYGSVNYSLALYNEGSYLDAERDVREDYNIYCRSCGSHYLGDVEWLN